MIQKLLVYSLVAIKKIIHRLFQVTAKKLLSLVSLDKFLLNVKDTDFVASTLSGASFELLRWQGKTQRACLLVYRSDSMATLKLAGERELGCNQEQYQD